jgi:hypothetical protein
VLSPSVGGLHCGHLVSVEWGTQDRVLPPSGGGLHCGEVEIGRDGNYARACPRRSAAAPLRNHPSTVTPLASGGEIPSFGGGLYCGGQSFDNGNWVPVPAVQRRAQFNSGSHCGRVNTCQPIAELVCVPTVQRRAPLRWR